MSKLYNLSSPIGSYVDPGLIPNNHDHEHWVQLEVPEKLIFIFLTLQESVRIKQERLHGPLILAERDRYKAGHNGYYFFDCSFCEHNK